MILLTGIFFSHSISAGEEIKLTPTLSKVKVFLQGAELNYTVNSKVEKGINEIVLTGLASNIVQNSIRVSDKGEAVIMSVVLRQNYLSNDGKKVQIKSLEDSLAAQKKLLAANINESDVLKNESDMIISNGKIGNEKIGVSVTELQKMAEFFRKHLSEIKERSYYLSLSSGEIQKHIDHIQQQLNEFNNQSNQSINEIVVTISANTVATVELNLSYVILDAGWTPIYDLHVDNTDSPLLLNYKANVRQNSSTDWNNVNIILSTRNQAGNNNKPKLNPWFIDFAKPSITQDMRIDNSGGRIQGKTIVVSAQAQGQMSSIRGSNISPPLSESLADYANVNQNQLSVEFTPQMKFSIPSDNKQHIVALQDYSIPAKYDYYCIPKLSDNAFLIAEITKWADYNLLPGQANIYFENSFVGNSSIHPSSTNDTLSISLGRDQNIIISRDVIKDFTEDKFLSSNIERTFAFEIKIKNNKKSSEKITVEDQIPISKNEDIVVRLIESSGAQFNSESGKLKWIVDVDGGKSATKKLIYSVKYPGNQQIPNL
jgi:uncharacterized protein (TIGR02231 family)